MSDTSAAPSAPPSAPLSAHYFDGRTARAHDVLLHVRDDRLHIVGDGVDLALPLAGLAWPERTRHGARLLHLPEGGSLQARDVARWDDWTALAAGRRDSLVVRTQQAWGWVAASLAALVLLAAIGYRWGLPLAARAVVAAMPASLDASVGDVAMHTMDTQGLVTPSQLPPARQQAIRRAFAEAVSHLPANTVPAWRLEFRHADRIGPNAFALPGGPIVVTDELVQRPGVTDDMVTGVLGHELGHLRHRHGMRMLVASGIAAAITTAVYGDFSSTLALVPAWLAQASYSRDAEREADAESVRLLRANGLSPAVMARFFEALRVPKPGDAERTHAPTLVGLASHPADAERIATFERAARPR